MTVGFVRNAPGNNLQFGRSAKLSYQLLLDMVTKLNIDLSTTRVLLRALDPFDPQSDGDEGVNLSAMHCAHVRKQFTGPAKLWVHVDIDGDGRRWAAATAPQPR